MWLPAIHAEIYDYMQFNLFTFGLVNDMSTLLKSLVGKVNSFVLIICLKVGVQIKPDFTKPHPQQL